MPRFMKDDGLGELTVETERIEVTSGLPRPDKSWRFTDTNGHEHSWQEGREPYSTLREVVDETYWCDECGDEHEASHLECAICGEHITPGMTGPSGFREFVPGRTEYRLNGEPITEERAREILDQRRRGR